MKSSALILGSALALLSGCTTMTTLPADHGHKTPPAEFWLDLARGDQVSDAEVFDDLATAGAVYVGEAHTIQRHHAIQLRVMQELFARGVPLALCMEQLEARDQPAVDRYNRREIDFDTLAKEINWTKKWGNYLDYRALCEFAREHHIPVRALNAPAEIIRAVSRGGGLAKLPADQRAQLPPDIVLDDPVYERLTNLELAVHMAMDAAKLRPVFEAQVSRDETMAANIAVARHIDTPADKPRTALVVVGAGHMRYGLGTADRVRRREPGLIERLVIMTESGELQMSDALKAQSREITITHSDLRAVGRIPADYVRVLPRQPELPPGHPPTAPKAN